VAVAGKESSPRSVSRPLVAVVVVGLGAGLIVVGWLLDSHEYSSALLRESGIIVLLVLPLLWIEHLFEQRIQASEEQTRHEVGAVAENVVAMSTRLTETRQSLSDLQEHTSTQLQAAASAETALAQEARDQPSFDTINKLFRRADELHTISEYGLRVVIPHQWERLRFHYPNVVESVASNEPSRSAIALTVEDAAGKSIGVKTVWEPGQSPADALLALADTWKRVAGYPGDSVFDAESIFRRLIDSIDLAIRSRRTSGDGQLSPLIELLSAHWAMTDFGLEHVPMYYPIPRGELIAESELTDWRQHMSEKPWISEENEASRQTQEYDFWMVSEVAHIFFAAHKPATV
jgi:hypothetical protein